jgi:HD-GYP domain-containing protein (c-di-GMP phosphodiesterase class II)
MNKTGMGLLRQINEKNGAACRHKAAEANRLDGRAKAMFLKESRRGRSLYAGVSGTFGPGAGANGPSAEDILKAVEHGTVTLIGIMGVLEKLKNMTRHSRTSAGRVESVAEHCWRLGLLAYFVRDEFPEADINRVVLMCLMHDIGEAFMGDIPAFEKTKEDESAEDDCGRGFLKSLPAPYRTS